MTDWIATFRAVVFPWHCDHFGRVTARWYAAHFDDASFHLLQRVGLSFQYLKERGTITAVIGRSTITYIQEMRAGDLLVARSGFTELGNRSVKRESRMYNADTEVLCATEQAVDVVFDEATRQSAPMPDDVRQHLGAHLVPAGET